MDCIRKISFLGREPVFLLPQRRPSNASLFNARSLKWAVVQKHEHPLQAQALETGDKTDSGEFVKRVISGKTSAQNLQLL